MKPKGVQREIKFRAFKNGKWFYSDDEAYVLRHIDGKLYLVEIDGFYSNSRNFELVVIGEVTQYTGLKDKKGNNIYEGDIVICYNRLYEIAINFNGYYLQRYKLWNGRFKPSFKYAMSLMTKPFKKGEWGESGGVVDDAEIVGNIYQNPEMVEKIVLDL